MGQTGCGRVDAQARSTRRPGSEPPSSKGPSGAPELPSARALPGQPFPGTKSIHASVSTQTPPSIAGCHRWDKDFTKPWPWVRARRCHRSSSILLSQDSPFLVALQGRCASSLQDPGVLSSYNSESLVAPPSQTPPTCRKTTPNLSPDTAVRPAVSSLRLHHPGCQQQSYFQGKDSQVVNLESRISLLQNLVIPETLQMDLQKKKCLVGVCWKRQCP